MMPQQSKDGTAHLAYFDVRTQRSYVWDGKSDKIEVCPGGYGEPVTRVIDAPRLFKRSDPRTDNEFIDVIHAFAIICSLDADNRPEPATASTVRHIPSDHAMDPRD